MNHLKNPRRKVKVAATLLVLMLLLSSCTRRSQIQVLAFAVRTAAMEFQSQRNDVRTAFSLAQAAKQEAMRPVELKFSDKRTQKFIKKWRVAESEVKSLRKKFNEVIKESDFFFVYCEKRLGTINDVDTRSRAAGAVQNKKAAFSDASVKTDRVIDTLEITISKGNDVITSLEIVGALNRVSEQIVTLGALHDQALEKLPEIDILITEGQGLLETELENLGV